MNIRDIWIVRTGALGDFVLTLPVIHNLRRAVPNARISLLGNSGTLVLAREEVDQICDINTAEWVSLFAPHSDISPHLLERFGNTDLAISYLPDPNGLFATHLKRAGVQTVIVHPPKPADAASRGAGHAIDHLLQPIRDLGFPIYTEQPTVHLTARDCTALAAPLSEGPPLLIHPGSGGTAKCWPPEHFIAVANAISRHKACSILISTGPADGELAHCIAARARARVLPQLPLRSFAALMRQCRAYLGNDSGPSHLAAAMGLPTLALFGPTDPRIWAPRGASVHILQASDGLMGSLSPHVVISKILEMMAMKSCP